MEIQGIKAVVALNIRNKRSEKKLSQTDLAKAAGLTPRYISRIENDPQNLTIDSLNKISKTLGCEMVELLGVSPAGEAPKSAKDAIKMAINTLKTYQASIAEK